MNVLKPLIKSNKGLYASATILLALLLSFSTVSNAEYLAYAIDKKNKERPLPENVDPLDAKDLLNVKWSPFAGKKSRVGVMRVENNSNHATVSINGPNGTQTVTYSASNSSGIPVQGIEAIITDALLNSGRFRLVERAVLDKALREQDLGASGRIAKPSAAKVGKVLGAEYLVQAVVTNYEPDFKGKKMGLGGLVGGKAGALLGGVGVKSKKSMVGMNFRLIDATTSEVMFTKQVESIISEKGLSFGGFGGGFTGSALAGLGGFMSDYAKTPIGQAVIAAINKGVFELVKQVGTSPVSGSVIKVAGKKIYINLGSNAVSNGSKLQVLSKGEELIDPETGISLGSEEEEIGTIKVASVKEKYAIATPVDFNVSLLTKGDKVMSSEAAAELEFGPPWKKKKKLF